MSQEEAKIFLNDKYLEIKKLFALEGFGDTKKKLDELGRCRVKKLFPNIKTSNLEI